MRSSEDAARAVPQVLYVKRREGERERVWISSLCKTVEAFHRQFLSLLNGITVHRSPYPAIPYSNVETGLFIIVIIG